MDAFALLRQFEGFRETPYWDVNAYRTGYGSDTITRPDGSVVPVAPGMKVGREDAERDLQRRVNTEFMPRAMNAVGQDNWSRLTPAQQAALTSITYNYGSLPKTVAAAVASGDPNAVGQAITALGSHNGGINANRRAQEAAIFMGQPFQGGGELQGTVSTKTPGLLGQPEQPKGLLGMNPERLDRLSLALMALSGSPTLAPLMANVSGRMEDRRDERKTNTTAEIIATRFNRPDLAELVKAGGLDAASALRLVTEPAEKQGRVLTHIQLQEMFPGAQIEPGLYNLKDDNTISKVGGAATTVNVNTGDNKFDENFGKSDADALAAIDVSGLAATRNIGRINQLEQLLQNAPTGAEGVFKQMAGELGVATEGLSDIQAAQALINSLVPEQRQPGSGPMSDADLALFKQSLPRIINQPGGNEIIIATMRSIAEYDAAGSKIVQELRAGNIDRATAFKMLRERENPLAQFKAPAGGAQEGGDIPTYNPNTEMWE